MNIRGAVVEWMPLVLAVAYVIQRGAIKIAEIWQMVASGQASAAAEIAALRQQLKELEERDA